VSFSPVYLRLSRERWRYLIVGARYIVQPRPITKTWRFPIHVKISSALPDWQGNRGCNAGYASGRRATTAPWSPGGNALRKVRRGDDLSARRWLLVRGIAAPPGADRSGGMPVPELSPRQDRGIAEVRQWKRSV